MTSRRSFWLVLAAALGAGIAATACSGATIASFDPCQALSSCCDTMTGASQSACVSTVNTARAQGALGTCSAALQTYTSAGACGGATFDAGVPNLDATVPSIDGATPCGFPGAPGARNCVTEDAGVPSSGMDAGQGSRTSCQSMSCSVGGTYQWCITVDGASTCTAAIRFPDGTSFACTSCSDCTAATALAQQYCTSVIPPPQDAGMPETGPVCGTTPTLHPEMEAGVFCPFTAVGTTYCAPGQQCCESPVTAGSTSTCATAGTGCPIVGSLAWECDGPVDCTASAGGPVCCAAGTVQMDPACGFLRGSAFTGSHCATSCAAGEMMICDAPGECAAGTICTPFKVAGVHLGTCL